MHPRRMSIPTTCQAHNKDIIFHVLYGGNRALVWGLIEESVIGVAREYPSDGVRDALQLMRPHERDCMNKLRVKFFMLLNEDEAMRRALCEPLKTYSYIQPLSLHKARRLYDELSDSMLPAFVQDETVSLEDFVDRLRSAYLCC